VNGLTASLPSPSDGTIDIGPLSIHAYGLMIALGVIVGVRLLGKRMVAKSVGTAEDASSIAVWGVVGGVIGARLYHVATDWSKFSDNLAAIPQMWKGGLGIPGGLIGGVALGAFAIRRKGLRVGDVLGCAAPAIPLSQAVGRWGNWFNQELFGRPTTRPWGLKIDPAHRPIEFPNAATFHPTFLYESLANLGLCALLLLIDRRKSIRPGRLFAMYVGGYGIIRFFVEGMRIDEAHKFGGLRLNQWTAIAAIAGAALYLAFSKATSVQLDTETNQADADADADAEIDVSQDLEVDRPEPRG
jgi:prolipoprotein diacylglyceryl transferase